MNSFDLWNNVASSTQSLAVDVGVPFWEVALGLCLAFFVLFLILVGLSKSLKSLLRR